eukprot:scaffold138275_cov80-Attheya_sp.AAC.1
MGSNGILEVNTTDIHGNTPVTRGYCTIDGMSLVSGTGGAGWEGVLEAHPIYCLVLCSCCCVEFHPRLRHCKYLPFYQEIVR